MNDYTKGILTGASLILCFFMLVSAKSQLKDDIFNQIVAQKIMAKEVVADSLFIKSIIVVDENAERVGAFHSFENKGLMGLYTAGRKMPTVLLVSGDKSGGSMSTFDSDFRTNTFLGATTGGGGIFEAFNENGEKVASLGTNKENDGMVVLLDRYGDIGWGASGKK